MSAEQVLSERARRRQAAIDGQRLALPALQQALRQAERGYEEATAAWLMSTVGEDAVDAVEAAEAQLATVRRQLDRLLTGLRELGDGALPGWAQPHYR